MRFNYDDYFGVEQQTGYETLLYDAMTGDRSLFKRADIDRRRMGGRRADPQAWREGGCGLAAYTAGSDGPMAADDLLARDERQWRPL